MRKAATDSNQVDIMKAMRGLGYSVVSLHRVGAGVPDFAAAKRNLIILCECKVDKGKLTPAQEKFHKAWNAEIHILRSVDDAIALDRKLWGKK